MARRRVVKPKAWLFLLMAVGLIFCFLFAINGRVLTDKDAEIQALLDQKEQVALTNSELARKIEFAKTDLYIERVAHEELGLLRPDEMRIVEAGS
jgi:cell division protein FtsB